MAQRDPVLDAFGGNARFLVERRVGGGGMGVVYQALDRQRNERVALKTMREPSPDRLLRFKNEFRALAELRHPNLVRLYELIEDGGWWFFTMELVDGEPLLSYVARDGGPHDTLPSLPLGRSATVDLHVPAATATAASFDETRLRDAVGQLAEGLAALHGAGQIHRDIKPANVLVTREGRVVILDFGLVKEAPSDGLRTVSSVAGTLAYMAPEHAAGLPVTAASDWYSFGVVLYQALTGQLPYPTPPIGQLSRPLPPAPRARVAHVPADLDELCLDLLSSEPELRPAAGEILARLSRAPEGVRTTADAIFVGRQEELAALQSSCQAATRQPRVIVVEGESGVGKSALLRELGTRLRALEPRPVVLGGRCTERESLPFKTLDGVVDALSRFLTRLPATEAASLLPRHAAELAQVFPVLRRHEQLAPTGTRHEVPDPAERRLRAFAALRELLARIADRWPLVLIIDDLHWGDEDGLRLLGEVLRAPGAPALAVVGTLRAGMQAGAAPVTRALLDQQLPCTVASLLLGPLPAHEAQTLARRLLARDRVATVNAAAVVADAGGNPLFISELCRHARSSGSARLDEILCAEIDRFVADARRLVELVALAGVPTPLAVIAYAAALKPEVAAAHVGRLVEARLLSASGSGVRDRLEPFHDRVREAALARLSAADRALLHQRLALALEGSGQADPAVLATHCLGAGERAKAATLFARAAADAAGALAFARAAALYRRSLELEPDGDAARARLVALGDALHDCGHGVAAAAAYQRAAAASSGLGAIDLRRRAAEQLLRGGHVDEGQALLARVLDEVQLDWPQRPGARLPALVWQRARLRLGKSGNDRSPEALMRVDVCTSAAAGIAVVDPLLGAYFQSRALELANKSGEPERLCRALTIEAVNLAALGTRQRARAAAVLARAGALAETLPLPIGRALVAMSAGVVAFLLGDWQASARESDRAVELYREGCKGAGWELGNAVLFAILARVYLGELGRLSQALPVAAAEAAQRGDLHATIALGTGQPILVRLAADDADGARRQVEALTALRPGQKWPTQEAYFNLFAHASIDLYRGGLDEACRRCEEGWPQLERSFLLRLQLIRLVMIDLRARAALALGARDGDARWLAAAERDARRLERERVAWAEALAGLLRGGIASARGDREGAVAAVAACAEKCDGLGMALHAAVARRAHGELRGDAGRAEVATADAWMQAQQIRDPRRFARLLAPGFGTTRT